MAETGKMAEDQVAGVPSDPWAAAFAALNKETEKDPEGAPDTPADDAVGDGKVSPAQGDDGSQDTGAPEGGDGAVPEGDLGGAGDVPGEPGAEDDDGDWFGVDVSPEQLSAYRKAIEDQVNERVIQDVAKMYVERGARNTNGNLGATINDEDVCKRDRDGVPRFYNPETGREFTGPNPRKEAQEWVDAYNKELADSFNKTCADYAAKLMAQEEGKLAILEFAPTYKSLDPIRRDMLDSIIEDYEVLDDNGEIMAYSCDLNKALAAVNRQVSMIQARYAKAQGGTQAAAPSGPALDTPSTSPQQGGDSKPPEFKSIAEAMEWQQDQLLAKMRNGGRR